MAKKLTQYSIFLSSPSDVKSERDEFPIVIQELNQTYGKSNDISFEVLKWEKDSAPGITETYTQELISNDIGDEYDIFIGILWKKFGTKATQQKFLTQFPEKKGFLRYGGAMPQFYNYLNGKILFMGMVRGEKDDMFLKQKISFDELYSKMYFITNHDTQILKQSNSTSSLFELLQTWEKKGIEIAIKQYGN